MSLKMKKNIWLQLVILFDSNNIYRIELALELLIPYIKVCGNDYWKKAQSYGLSIAFEDFYSNVLLNVWEGLLAYDKDKQLNLKNVVLYRLSISEKKTWRQYRKTDTFSKETKVNYSSARWEELDFTCTDTRNFTNDIVALNWLENCIEIYHKKNYKGAQVIKLLSLGYSSKEAFLAVYNVPNYTAKERKQMERIKKDFKSIFTSTD